MIETIWTRWHGVRVTGRGDVGKVKHMAVAKAVQTPGGYREVYPVLYESTEDHRDHELTREYVDAVKRVTTSQVLVDFLEDALRQQEHAREAKRRKPVRPSLT